MKRALRALTSVAPEFAAISCLVAIIWWGIGTMLSTQHARALGGARRDTTNLAHAFAANTQRIVAGADQVLLSLRAAYERDGDRFDLPTWIKRESAPDLLTAKVAIIGSAGMVLASTVSPQRFSVADREYFVVQRESSVDELFISKPIMGRGSGRWTIQLTRKIIAADGSFKGLVLVSVDCQQLSAFYQSLNLQHGFIELVGLDGIVRARGPFEDGAIGSRLPFMTDAVSQEPSGVFRAQVGGDAFTVSHRQLPDYKLVVLVGFSDKSVLSSYRYAQKRMLWSGAAATLGLCIVGAFWIPQRRRTTRFHQSVQVMLESMSQGLVMVDSGQRVRVVNRRALELLGLPLNALSVLAGWRTKKGSRVEQELLHALDRLNGSFSGRSTDTDQPVLESTVSPIPTGGSVQTITDVTARHVADRRIRHMALHDHLTGLGNRVLFADEADHLLDQAAQQGTRLAVLCLDLDGLKRVNDTFGHEMGDMLLVQVAKRLTDAVQDGGVIARTGGDEFAILVRTTDEADAARAVAHELLDALRLPFTINGQVMRVAGSIGVAQYPADGSARPELLRHADLALYAAKTDRHRPIRLFDPGMADSARLKQQLDEDLRTAIGTEQLFLEFQPQFRTVGLAVVGFEALVRWNHPVHGRLGPDAFIPLAEETGLIVALGRQVLEQACRVALHWPDHVHIAVNLSPVQFCDPQIVQTISTVLASTGLPASRLELEVTEGVLIADEQGALDTLRELRELGVVLALDDFGTGYASLSYLRKFPFERIKLDRSFVQAQVIEERSRHILQAILGLSHDLHLSVVAEGVETRTQLDLLREQGCHAVQGFLVGRPMSQYDAGTLFAPTRIDPPGPVVGPGTRGAPPVTRAKNLHCS